jgi:putative transposase
MTGKRKRYSADFKAKVALEALKGELTLSQLAAKHGVHQTMIAGWRKQAIEGLAGVFTGKGRGERWSPRGRTRQAARQDRPAGGGVGFFSQSLRSLSLDRRRQMIEPDHRKISIQRQCALVSISRSAFYYQPAGETPLTDGQILTFTIAMDTPTGRIAIPPIHPTMQAATTYRD